MAVSPDAASKLIKQGFTVNVEKGAGEGSNFQDSSFASVGAKIVDTESVFKADILLKVRPPTVNPLLGKCETEALKKGQTLISFLYPVQNENIVKKLQQAEVTSFAMDQIPRISRAQVTPNPQ